MRLRWVYGVVAGILAMFSAADAAQLITSNGKLLGASGVEVLQQRYNVEFRDGTCIELFGGCNSESDFAFQDQDSATRAAKALLDQVLVNVPQGMFDSAPTLTRGCIVGPAFDLCVIATPFRIDATHVFTMKAYNWPSVTGDWLEMNAYQPDNNFEDAYTTWARWSVPEPGSLTLLGMALVGYCLARRTEPRRGRKERTRVGSTSVW